MVSNRCKLAVRTELKKLGLHFIVVDLGEVEIMENINAEKRALLKLGLLDSGLELMDDKKAILIEQIKNIIIQMIHHSVENIKVNFSDFLAEKLSHNYTYMANLFSEVQGITIEHYIISNKIERIKELMIYGELNITEIAWKMGVLTPIKQESYSKFRLLIMRLIFSLKLDVHPASIFPLV